MNRDDVIKYQLVERYVRNRLDEATCKAFEIYLLDHPETLEEVRIEEALYLGMKQLGMKQQRPTASSLPTQASSAMRKPAVVPYAVAASCALFSIFTLALLWQEKSEHNTLRQQLASPWIDARFLRLETVRAVDDFKTAEHIPFDSRLGARLFVQLEPISYELDQSYRVDVFRLNDGDRVSSGRELLISYQARVNEAGYLQTELPFQVMVPGYYYLRVNDLEEDAYREYRLVITSS